jgi:hypothetical protein
LQDTNESVNTLYAIDGVVLFIGKIIMFNSSVTLILPALNAIPVVFFFVMDSAVTVHKLSQRPVIFQFQNSRQFQFIYVLFFSVKFQFHTSVQF